MMTLLHELKDRLGPSWVAPTEVTSSMVQWSGPQGDITVFAGESIDYTLHRLKAKYGYVAYDTLFRKAATIDDLVSDYRLIYGE